MNVSTTGKIILPLKDGTLYEVEEDDFKMWAVTYPSIDIVQQFREMYAWLVSNPSKRKTRRGIKKFINGWLSRSKPEVESLGFIEKHTDKSWVPDYLTIEEKGYE